MGVMNRRKSTVKKGAAHTAGDDEEPARKSDLARAKNNLSPVLIHGLDWINSHLLTHQELILMTKANLESGQIKHQNTLISTAASSSAASTGVSDPNHQEHMPDVWHKTYTGCRSIPKYYLAHWMTAGPSAIAADVVDSLDSYDPTLGLRKAFGFLTGLTETTWWPPALHTRTILTEWLKGQFARMSGPARAKLLVEQCNKATGDVEWSELCPYQFSFSGPNIADDMDCIDEEPDVSSLNITTITHRFLDVTVGFE